MAMSGFDAGETLFSIYSLDFLSFQLFRLGNKASTNGNVSRSQESYHRFEPLFGDLQTFNFCPFLLRHWWGAEGKRNCGHPQTGLPTK